MHRLGRTIWAERALMVLFLASMAGTVNLIVMVHRKAAVKTRVAEPVAPAVEAVPTASPVKVTPVAEPKDQPAPSPPIVSKPKAPAPAPAPSLPPEDPTKKALAAIAAATAREIAEAEQADRRTEAFEKARAKAEDESKRWRRREMLVKQQVAALDEQAHKIDRQLDTLAAERDVLAAEHDGLKAALAKAKQGEGSYAVLPYKGENGTWRRPIVMECANGTVTLLPKGPTFSLLDLATMINPRSSPVILAIARELVRIQGSESPDGAPVVPYFVFLVRPDGIRPYYEIRARLERLGIAFGYELIEQNLKVDVPDYDNLATWDGTIPLDEPLVAAPRGGGASASTGATGKGGGSGNGDLGAGDGLAWPSAGTVKPKTNQPGRGRDSLAGISGDTRGTAAGGETPGDFVWPAQPGGSRAGRSRGSAGGGFGTEKGGLAAGGGAGAGAGASAGTGVAARPGNGGNGGVQGRGVGGAGSGGGASPGVGKDSALARWPFPYPPPGTELTDDVENTGTGAGGGLRAEAGRGTGAAGGMGGAGDPLEGIGLQPRPGAPGLGAQGGGGLDDKGIALLPDLEPATDEPGRAGASAPGGEIPGTRSGAPVQGKLSDLIGQGAVRGGPRGSRGTGSGSPPGRDGNSASADEPEAESALAGRSNNAAGSGGSPGGSMGQNPGLALDALLGAQGQPSSPNANANANANPSQAPSGVIGLGLGSALGRGLSSLGGASSPTGGAPSGASGGTGLSLGSDAGPPPADPKGGDSLSDTPTFKSRIQDGPTKTIQVPFEIVVVCEPQGLVIHPGGYRISGSLLQSQRKDGVLVKALLAVANLRAAADPTIRPLPRVKFLVESGGSPTFWAARKQILFSGLGWPMSLQVTGAQNPPVLGQLGW